MKLNYVKLKDWWTKPVNVGKSYNEYDDKSPSQWGVDNFKSFVSDNLDSKNTPTKQLAVFGFPNENLVKWFSDNPNGFNNDKNWNKYKNFGGAMYDIFQHLQSKFSGSKSTTNESKMTKNKKYRLLKEILTPIVKKSSFRISLKSDRSRNRRSICCVRFTQKSRLCSKNIGKFAKAAL